MEQNQQHQQRTPQQQQPQSSNSRPLLQSHPARPAITDLFNRYLGRNARQRADEPVREPPNKAQKRVTALNRDLPPPNEQFILEFEQLQRQFSDQEQLRLVTESVLISLVVQCSTHAPRAEFLLFALRSLCGIGFVNWDTVLPSLLNSIHAAELTIGHGSQTANMAASTSISQSGMISAAHAIAAPSHFQSSTPASPMIGVQGMGSPAHSVTEPSPNAIPSPVKLNESSSSLRHLCCKIILIGLDSSLKPLTHAEIFRHILTWLVNWDQRQQSANGSSVFKSRRLDKALIEWLHSCLDVIWLLVEEDKCRIPFYELLRSGLQFIDNIPDDEAFFTLILEIHRRRDMMAMHMQMLDQHLHCPSFGVQRFFPLVPAISGGEAATNMRFSPITYPSVLGEPLHGEMGGDIAMELYSFEGSSDLVNGVDIPPSTRSDAHGDDMGNAASWYDSDEEAGGPYGQERELQKRSEEMYNSGYRDGITAGQNASVQQGFDEGLKESFSAGYKWGLVRGITSAFTCLPDQLKAQMVDTEEHRSEFKCLGESVRSVSSEDALKMFHENILTKKESEKQRGDDEEPHGQSSGRVSLESYSQRLELLLEKSPAIKIHTEAVATGLAL